MQAFNFSLQPQDAINVYAAVGKQISEGDLHPAEGETYFGAAVAAICQGYVNPPTPATSSPSSPTSPATARTAHR